MSRSSKDPSGGDIQGRKEGEKTPDCLEIELDTQQLRALKEGEQKPNLDDTAANLELSQSLDDLRNLSWPLWKPRD